MTENIDIAPSNYLLRDSCCKSKCGNGPFRVNWVRQLEKRCGNPARRAPRKNPAVQPGGGTGQPGGGTGQPGGGTGQPGGGTGQPGGGTGQPGGGTGQPGGGTGQLIEKYFQKNIYTLFHVICFYKTGSKIVNFDNN